MRGYLIGALALFTAVPVAAQTAPDPADKDTPSGLASYYGKEMSGNRTASGERFDPEQLTAAHRSFPFGSRVEITHLATGLSTIVRINDRGPFRGNRIIDMSRAAAHAIGLDRLGTGRVRLRLLGR